MSKKELINKIEEDTVIRRSAIEVVLRLAEAEGWLHDPDQVPGRTITESAEKDLYDSAQSSGAEFRATLSEYGITVVPDPEPTNAERIKMLIMAGVKLGGHINELAAESIAEHLDEAGVKAPEAGGDDEQ